MSPGEIMRFRKRPVEIEAFQWDGGIAGGESIAAAFPGVNLHAEADDPRPPRLSIATLEGVMCAAPGDWIIRGVKGEVYPCKPEIFAATYDALPDPASLETLLDAAPRGGRRRALLTILWRNRGIRNVAELARLTRRDVLRMKQVGPVMAAEIDALLAEHGRMLAGES